MKDFLAAIGSGEQQRVLALVAEDIDCIFPGENWPLAGAQRGHAGSASVLERAAKEIDKAYPKPPELVAEGDRLVCRRRCYGNDQGHGQDVQGRMGVRHRRSQWQTDENSANTGKRGIL